MPRVLLFLLIVGAVVYAVVDIANSEDDERLGMPPFLWIVLVILVPVLGTIVWLAVSRTQRARRGTRPATATSYRTLSNPAQPQPLAPDDDPEFLWLLEQARIKKQREEQAQRAAGEDTAGPDGRGEDDGHRTGDQDEQPRA
jgi:hypothetical protein